MRSDYQLTDSLQQLVSNPNVKEEGNLYDYQPALDLTALLRSLDIPTTSWFVPLPTHTHTITIFLV